MKTIFSLQKETNTILLSKINSAKSISELEKLDATVTNHYNNGTLNTRQFKSLDCKILDLIIKKEHESNP